MNSFGSLLRDLRMRHPERLSIREVCRRAGIDVSYLSRMEKDEVGPPREEVIARLADVLEAGDPDREHLYHLARKLPPEVRDYLHDRYQEAPAFFRTLMEQDPSPEELRRITSQLRRTRTARRRRGS